MYGYFVIVSCGQMHRDHRCMYMAHVCFYVRCSDCVNVCCIAAVVMDSVFLALKYVGCLCKGFDGGCVFSLYCDAWSCRCSCMGSMSVADVVCLSLVCIMWQFSILHSA